MFDDCGFNYTACMDTNFLHVQFFDLFNEDLQPYGLQARCRARANEPARADGLFAYLEDIVGVPGASGALGDVEDVVGYCLGLQGNAETEATQTSGSSATGEPGEGVDSTGGGTGNDDVPTPDRGHVPAPCGSHATERYWVRPTNNFGAWTETAGGIGVGSATHGANVTSGGIAYTLLPCAGMASTRCIRIDRLSVLLSRTDGSLAVLLTLEDVPASMPLTDEGSFDVAPGALRLQVRDVHDARQQSIVATNPSRARGKIDARSRTARLDELIVSSEQGDVLATMSLAANLTNMQPSTSIEASYDARSGNLLLEAETFDADRDPIVHHWMIPGTGRWRGDAIAITLPVGRHAVILYADDVHRARDVAARWVDVLPSEAN